MASAAESLALARTEARKRLRLTDRWTPMKPHPMQSLLMWHASRFKIAAAGRRSGKTETLKRKAVLRLLKRSKGGGPSFIALAAPSYGQARDILWNDILELVPPAWIAKKYDSTQNMEIVTPWGARLRVFGFERPRRIEGTPWDFVGVDEAADCKAGCFARHIRPALATVGREGECDMIGTPDEVGHNQAEFEKLFETGLQYPLHPDTCSFHWGSADIIAAEEMESMKTNMGSLEYIQETGGKFVTSGGKALPFFDYHMHVNAELANYSPMLPLDWSLDFGTAPAMSLLCQSYGQHVWVFDEIRLDDSSTEVACMAFGEKVQEHGLSTHRVRIFGDAAGRSPHSNVGTSDYEIIEQRLRGLPLEFNNLTHNPPIKDTLNAVRGRVSNAKGMIFLHIHPRCTNLIEDCKSAPWPSDLRKFHALAALRYYCFEMFSRNPGIVTTAPLHLAGSVRREQLRAN